MLQDTIYTATDHTVKSALAAQRPTIEDFCALVSPAAQPYLEKMAVQSRARTQIRFGKTVQLFAPLYLSNECTNICTYCGFSVTNTIPRKTLTDQEILAEVEVLKQMGIDHVLLVTGENSRAVGLEYLERAICLIRPFFSNISIEVQPLEVEAYRRLRTAGLHGVLVYQETYNQYEYKKHHPKGKKSNFSYRLETPDRLGAAGVHKIGIGALLGLSDWRVDAASVALHLDYLQKKYWKSKYAISFPRLRPAAGVSVSGAAVSERNLVQLLCAFRIWNESVELSLSTRERASFRDNAFPLGVTTMSAGSRTDPGGYATQAGALKQFSIDDERTTKEVAEAIRRAGYEAVWKDWDSRFDEAIDAHTV